MKASPSAAIEALNKSFLLDFPADAARSLETLPLKEAARLLSKQPTHVLISLWRYLSPETGDQLLPLLQDTSLRSLLTEWEPIHCATTLSRLEDPQRERCLALLSAAQTDELEHLLSYPSGTAGRVMDTRVLRFRREQTVAEALSQLKRHRGKTLRHLLIIDEDNRLEATVDIQDIALAKGRTRLNELAAPIRVSVSPFDKREEVANHIKQFSLEVLPVVDINNHLLGVIRHETILKTLQEDAAADIQTMVGVSKEERALSPALFAVRKRLPWMEINLLTAFMAASVVSLFEATIAKFTALAVLMPVVAGQSGNAGAQALAVTMRGLALREISISHAMRVVFKEIRVGLINGVAIALTTAVGVYFWSDSFGLAAVIASAMTLSMVAAGSAGAMVPIVLTRLGQDPAQSSSIILTTVTDIVGFFSFLGIATLMSAFL
jgi:magnesium transporter